MNGKCVVACVQLTSSDDITENSKAIEQLIKQAASQKADFIALPENAYFMRREAHSEIEKQAPLIKYTMQNHPAILHSSHLAKKYNTWILIGSIAIIESGDERCFNRSVLINNNGEIFCTYDKIHLFDVSLQDGQQYKESARIRPGNKTVIAQTPFFNLGLTICYDLRFPHLYRTLAKNGAEVICVPSAFTVPTGKAHWEVLLRSRAIENSCYIIAPAQTGNHPGGRKTYGHSMIINPWGEILAVAENSPCIITAEIDSNEVATTRKSLPSLQHDATLFTS